MAGFNLADFVDPDYGHLKTASEQPTTQDVSQPPAAPIADDNTVGDMATAANTGFLQGATFGFGDEIAGATGAVVDLFTGQDKIIENGKEREASLVELYRRNKGDFKARTDESVAKNKGISMAAEVAGGILSPANKLLGGGSSLGKVVTKGAAGGGVAGLGYSEADSVKDMALDVAKGAGLGGALAGGLHGTGKAISKGMPTMADSIRKSITKASASDVKQEGLRIAQGSVGKEDKILKLGKELNLYSGGKKEMLATTEAAKKAKMDLVDSTISEANKTVDKVALKEALEKSREKLAEKVKANLSLNERERKSVLKDLNSRIDDFTDKVDKGGLDVIQKAKKAITKKLGGKAFLLGNKSPAKADVQKELSGELKTIVEDFTPNGTVKKANEEWGLLNEISGRVSKQDEKTVIGSFAPFLGIATGSAAAPVSLLAFNNLKRQVGARNLTAKVLDKIGKAAGSNAAKKAGLYSNAASRQLNAESVGEEDKDIKVNEKDYFNE